MYIRSALIMLISLYTSRVILKTLGEVDLGIYNLVSGVVVLFTFINGAMTSATQRHLSYELGKPDGDVSTIFSGCLIVHIVIALCILILAETIGLWFVNAKLAQSTIPPDRVDAAKFVYQFATLTCIVSVFRIPYSALVVAHEKFSFYAYSGILEAFLKLAIVFVLVYVGFDKLKLYSVLLFGVAILITFFYYLFSSIVFKDLKFKFVRDKSIYEYILSFSVWTILGSLANVGRHQGVSIVTGMYYGVAVNAAIAIAQQVNGAVDQFVTGFQQAFKPQLIKSHASDSLDAGFIHWTSKISYYILLIICVPLVFNIDSFLSLWLIDPPKFLASICTCILIATMIDSISGPLWVAIFATGYIKNYQIVVSIILLLNIPLAIICAKLGLPPYSLYVVCCIINLLVLFIRLVLAKREAGIAIYEYLKQVILPVSVVTVASLLIAFILFLLLGNATNLLSLAGQTISLLLTTSLVVFLLGFNNLEKQDVISMLRMSIINNNSEK